MSSATHKTDTGRKPLTQLSERQRNSNLRHGTLAGTLPLPAQFTTKYEPEPPPERKTAPGTIPIPALPAEASREVELAVREAKPREQGQPEQKDDLGGLNAELNELSGIY